MFKNNVDQTSCHWSEISLRKTTEPTFDCYWAAALVSASLTDRHTNIISTVLYRAVLYIQSRYRAVKGHRVSVVWSDFWAIFKPCDANNRGALHFARQLQRLSCFHKLWRLKLRYKCWGFCKWTVKTRRWVKKTTVQPITFWKEIMKQHLLQRGLQCNPLSPHHWILGMCI